MVCYARHREKVERYLNRSNLKDHTKYFYIPFGLMNNYPKAKETSFNICLFYGYIG